MRREAYAQQRWTLDGAHIFEFHAVYDHILDHREQDIYLRVEVLSLNLLALVLVVSHVWSLRVPCLVWWSYFVIVLTCGCPVESCFVLVLSCDKTVGVPCLVSV